MKSNLIGHEDNIDIGKNEKTISKHLYKIIKYDSILSVSLIF